MDDLHRSEPQTLKKHRQDPAPLPPPPPLSLTDGSEATSSASSLMEVDGEEHDEVVREIDVFFNPSIDQDAELYMVQYPLRPSWRPYELGKRCAVVRMKPKQSEVEVVFNMDFDSDNYDKNVAEPLRLQKQTLSSLKSCSLSDYAVGLLIRNQLHLNPVHTILQFRPSFKHLNKGDNEKKLKSVEVDTKPDKGKSVSGSVRANVDCIEPWLLLEYNDIGSTSSDMYQKKMQRKLDDNVQFTMKQSDYLNSLCPKTSSTGKVAKGPSKSFLPSEPLEKRLIEWLKGCQVNRFAALLHLDLTALDSADAKDEFLKLLQHHAYLVQGLWVSKSNLLCQGRTAIQRDYLLFLFSRNCMIPKSKLKELRIDSKALKHLLRPLAYERSFCSDWKFKEETDLLFIKGYPSVVKKEEYAWLSREKDLMESLHKVEKELPVAGRIRIQSKPVTGKGKSATGNADASTISNDNRESLKDAILHILSDRKAHSMSSIQRKLRDLALSMTSRQKKDHKTIGVVNAVVSATTAPLFALQSAISEVAFEVHGVYVLKSVGNPVLDPFRNIVIKLFQDKEPNATIKKQEIREAAHIELRREISDTEYNQVLKSLCVSVNGAWLLRLADN